MLNDEDLVVRYAAILRANLRANRERECDEDAGMRMG